MNPEYNDILKSYGITEEQLPEKTKSYIKKKVQNINASIRLRDQEATKEKPSENKINGRNDSIATMHEEINRAVIEACEEIEEKRQQDTAEAERIKAEEEAAAAKAKADAEAAAAAEKKDDTTPPADTPKKRKLFRFFKTIEEKQE